MNLVKHYDVNMDVPAQAASIAQGPGKVQGLKFEAVELETRKKETIVDYVNKVKDVDNDETNQKPNESSENATVAGDRTGSEDSEDEIPLVELEAMRRRKRRKEKMEKILKEAASAKDFKENDILSSLVFYWLVYLSYKGMKEKTLY